MWLLTHPPPSLLLAILLFPLLHFNNIGGAFNNVVEDFYSKTPLILFQHRSRYKWCLPLLTVIDIVLFSGLSCELRAGTVRVSEKILPCSSLCLSVHHVHYYVSVCASIHVCVCACVRACMHACVRVCVHCVQSVYLNLLLLIILCMHNFNLIFWLFSFQFHVSVWHVWWFQSLVYSQWNSHLSYNYTAELTKELWNLA